MNIRTEYQFVGFMDIPEPWTAIDRDSYDGAGSPMGHGATEQDAIADLNYQIEDSIV